MVVGQSCLPKELKMTPRKSRSADADLVEPQRPPTIPEAPCGEEAPRTAKARARPAEGRTPKPIPPRRAERRRDRRAEEARRGGSAQRKTSCVAPEERSAQQGAEPFAASPWRPRRGNRRAPEQEAQATQRGEKESVVPRDICLGGSQPGLRLRSRGEFHAARAPARCLAVNQAAHAEGQAGSVVRAPIRQQRPDRRLETLDQLAGGPRSGAWRHGERSQSLGSADCPRRDRAGGPAEHCVAGAGRPCGDGGFQRAGRNSCRLGARRSWRAGRSACTQERSRRPRAGRTGCLVRGSSGASHLARGRTDGGAGGRGGSPRAQADALPQGKDEAERKPLKSHPEQERPRNPWPRGSPAPRFEAPAWRVHERHHGGAR